MKKTIKHYLIYIVYIPFFFILCGCAPSLMISNFEPDKSEIEIPSPTNEPIKVNFSAKILLYYQYRGPDSCVKNKSFEKTLLSELKNSALFELSSNPDKADMTIDLCFHTENDASNMEGPLFISGFTLGLIPSWYSRMLTLDLNAIHSNGNNSNYTKSDSFTAINWLPLTPFALYWSPMSVFENIAKEQLKSILAEVYEKHDHTIIKTK